LRGYCPDHAAVSYDRETVEEATVGLPVMFDGELTESRIAIVSITERWGIQLVTAGMYGWSMVATGVGNSVERACHWQ
jgi:hypothetical protein